ncbi:Arf-GAP with SH3 domain, ANK repeat and PH domain-containing protein 1 [Cyberlindnera fabianii]|uniref:Arf-GAP with SH3 domain, ANK repeat and PH domain-containing protein 1 n=1 Tax=Cyberlindnera fabianii TaxID=36022 RepID=A0A1V2L1N9_CYBFA|nr:Arf-GAP with SH3 domain, ANK repeat and PH domain-containing protein 1 [Cyberlindnera fabianii]
MIIYFPEVEYHSGQPYFEPLPNEPQLPYRFNNREHLRRYYDHVKSHVQLSHDGTKDGCRCLLKRYIHRDHRRLVLLVKKYFYTGVNGRKDERISSFWKEWEEIIDKLPIDPIDDTPMDNRPMRMIANLAQSLEQGYTDTSTPETFFHEPLKQLQRLFIQWPNLKHLELLITALCSNFALKTHILKTPALQKSLSIRFTVGHTLEEGLLIPQYTIHPETNIISFIRILIQTVIEKSLMIHESHQKTPECHNIPIKHLFTQETLQSYNNVSAEESNLSHSGHSVKPQDTYTTSSPAQYLILTPKPPIKPQFITSSHQLISHYSILKQYVQLAHSGSVHGFRDLLLLYIHPDQDTTLGVLVKSYGAGHLSGVVKCRGCFHCDVDSFWQDWEVLLEQEKRRYVKDVGMVNVMQNGLEKFEKRLWELETIGYPSVLMKREMHALQRVLVPFPDWSLLNLLVGVIKKHVRLGGDIRRHFEDDGSVKSNVCVLMFARELSQYVVEWTMERNKVITKGDVFSPKQTKRSTLIEPELWRSKRERGGESEAGDDKRVKRDTTCDFCGHSRHNMDECRRFCDLLSKGIFKYNGKGELCMRNGMPLVTQSKPIIKGKRFKTYLYDCGETLYDDIIE